MGSTYTVRDSANLTDTFLSTERLQFADAKIALDISGNPYAGFDLQGLANSGQVYRLYQAAFDRQPDKPGLVNWITQADASMPLVTITDHFINSWEFGVKYGNPTDHEFVALLYHHVLHRAGEPGGLACWNNLVSRVVRSGLMPLRMTQSLFDDSETKKRPAKE